MKLLVTGGAGFIGSRFVKRSLEKGHQVEVLDCLTYAGTLENLKAEIESEKIVFHKVDLRDPSDVFDVVGRGFDAVLNFAAESHVDNSIEGPSDFISTNILGTFHLLQAVRSHWESSGKPKAFRYVQVSTDEVFGSLGEEGRFTEKSPYAPNSPYSASKASADHLVRAWHQTYRLPTLITNSSNNYGPRQFPEKLIPRMITLALAGESLPVFGDGTNVRDWIHVDDNCAGIFLALEKGVVGESYCFGGGAEWRNIDLVHLVCEILDELKPSNSGQSYKSQITFVEDRPGHDKRYALDDSKAVSELGFRRQYPDLRQGLAHTVQWYLENEDWLRSIFYKVQ